MVSLLGRTSCSQRYLFYLDFRHLFPDYIRTSPLHIFEEINIVYFLQNGFRAGLTGRMRGPNTTLLTARHAVLSMLFPSCFSLRLASLHRFRSLICGELLVNCVE